MQDIIYTSLVYLAIGVIISLLATPFWFVPVFLMIWSFVDH